jgi:glutamate/tyrosine decarboxylase-like PLP-dependent enzyme
VCANAGTLNTGALDPLHALAELCQSGGHWLHIDATLGGLAALDPTLFELKALGSADSVTLAPHKWLGVPAECSVALVREGKLLERLSQEPGVASASLQALWQPEQSVQGHGFRALKLWATLLHLGRDGIRSRIEQHRALARSVAARIVEESRLELMAQPELSIVCFRYTAIAERSDDRLRAFNRALVAQMQAEGEVILTGAELKNGYALRASIMHHATRGSDVAMLLQTVLKTAARLNEAGFRTSNPQPTPTPLP